MFSWNEWFICTMGTLCPLCSLIFKQKNQFNSEIIRNLPPGEQILNWDFNLDQRFSFRGFFDPPWRPKNRLPLYECTIILTKIFDFSWVFGARRNYSDLLGVWICTTSLKKLLKFIGWEPQVSNENNYFCPKSDWKAIVCHSMGSDCFVVEIR